jgi:hypothetical protein
MNINEISNGQPVRPSISLDALKNAPPVNISSSSRTGISSDSVDTSVFSKLMQRGARELQQRLQPRAEKIAQFAGTMDDPIQMSDAVIHSILNSMAGA